MRALRHCAVLGVLSLHCGATSTPNTSRTNDTASSAARPIVAHPSPSTTLGDASEALTKLHELRRRSRGAGEGVLGVAGDRMLVLDVGRDVFFAERLVSGAREDAYRGPPVALARLRLAGDWLVGDKDDRVVVIDAARGELAFDAPGSSDFDRRLTAHAEDGLLLVRQTTGRFGPYSIHTRVFARDGRVLHEDRVLGDSAVWLSAGRVITYETRNDPGFVATDVRSGKVTWRWSPLKGPSAQGAPHVFGGLALVGGLGDSLFVRDIASGVDRPTIRIRGAKYVSPAGARGDVLLAEAELDREHSLVAIDVSTGAVRWMNASARVGVLHVLADALVVSTEDGTVSVRNPADGAVAWRASFEPLSTTVTSPAPRVTPVADAKGRLLGIVVADRSSMVVIERGASATSRRRDTP